MDHLLLPGHVLRVACGPTASALVSRRPSEGQTARNVRQVAGGETLTLGPFPITRIYDVQGGSVSLTPATTLPAPVRYVSTTGTAFAVEDATYVLSDDEGDPLDLTIETPDVDDDGVEIIVQSAVAEAHTIVLPEGSFLDGADLAKDLATFAAFIGASLHVRALGGAWHVLATRGVTLSASA